MELMVISYKHSPLEQKHAAALERGLNQYARSFLERPTKIFWDQKHMLTDNDLNQLIKNGLEESDYLVIRCQEDREMVRNYRELVEQAGFRIVQV